MYIPLGSERASIVDITGRTVAMPVLSEGINNVSATGMNGIYLLVTKSGTVKFAVR